MKYLWRDIIPKSTIYNISSSTLANSKNEYGKTQTLTDKMVSTAYYYRDGNAIPIIVFDDDANYTNSKLVDAFTGKDVP